MLTPLEAAREAVFSHLPEPEIEDVSVAAAGGRYLAADVTADRELPPADRSAMDGFAVRAADIALPPAVLRCVAEVAAGSDARPEVASGTCVKIFTGANVPPGADTVAIVEETEEAGEGMFRFLASTALGRNIRRKGEDAPRGRVLLEKGTRLGGSQISACAAVGADPVRVYRVPSVAVLSTGAELRDPSDDVLPHEIRNSNGPALIAALGQVGVFEALDLGGVEDDLEAIRTRIVEGVERCSALIVTGGVSKGDYDLVPAAVEAAGLRIHLHGVRMKPGKPFLFATAGRDAPVFALPGNPLSVLASFWELVAPALLAMMGDPEHDVWRVPARLTEEVAVRGDRTVLLPVHLYADREGEGFMATPVRDRSSADLAAGARANGTVKLEPDEGPFPALSLVEAHPWARPL
ncbi:MAG: molybdopterin molybdotransferase MoeA [Deltaproteobacteria bacterium]|nr:molybdopterin molybdotransferase MoeA [Deltaproteobacteria bacterium]